MFGQSKSQDFQCDTLISSNTTLVGDVHFSGGLHVDGCVRGNVIAEEGSNAVVRISEQGRIEGEIRSPRAIVNGQVVGNLLIHEHLELAEKARIDGDVHYAVVQMTMGAKVNGRMVLTAQGEPIKHKRGQKSNIESLTTKVQQQKIDQKSDQKVDQKAERKVGQEMGQKDVGQKIAEVAAKMD